MTSFRIVLATLVTLTLGLASCGGGGGSSQPNNASGLEKSAENVWSAIFNGKTSDAYAYMTNDCKDQVSEREFRDGIGALPSIFETFFGVKAKDISVDKVETRNVKDGKGEALVVLDAGDDDINQLLNDGNDYQEWVYEDGSWRIADCSGLGSDGGSGVDSGSSTPDGSSTSVTSRDDPAPLGKAIEVAGWEITVNSANPDATDDILAEDDFIDPPDDGHVFYSINITAKYVGDGQNDSQSIFQSLNWGAVGDSAVAYDFYNDACTYFSLPDALDDSAEVFEGGQVTGNICFSVTEDDAGSLQLYAEESFSFDGVREWFALR